MNKLLKSLIFIYLCGVTFCFGQGGTEGQDAERERVYQESIRRTQDEERRFIRSAPVLLKGNNILSKDDRAKLQPRDEDTAQHSNFLKQSKTGIFKIFPDFKCDRKIINIKDEKCLNAVQIFGNASTYSFVNNSHLFNLWSEIIFDGDSLKIFPTPKLLGIIKELDGVSLDTMDKDSSELNEIRNFRPPTSAGDIFETKNSVWNKVQAKIGKTYALRLMHFTKESFYRFERNDRTDRLLVLQIIRQESDQSLTVIWKEIERKKTRKLVY